MIPFTPIALEDRDWMQPIFDHAQLPSEEYSFTFCFIWRKSSYLKVAKLNDYLLVLADKPMDPTYLFPVGTGDLKPIIDALLDDAHRRGVPLRFHTLLGSQKEQLEALYPGQFIYKDLRDYADYIYDTQSLSTLAGKKLHGKRNHINRFVENHPDWTYEPITAAKSEECREMSTAWCEESDCDGDDDLKKESCAVKQALNHFEALRFKGGALRAGGEIIAFTSGDALTDDIFMVHIEKAFGDIQGAYPMINQQFVLAECQNYRYVNRQDDMGTEGLRRAKLSYQPVRILDKFSAEYVGPQNA